MNRWLIPAAALLAASAATAQITREAPVGVRPARMAVGIPPEITLDGSVDRLSPGARIRDTRNMLVLSGSLSGQTNPVLYRRDSAGLVHEVWLLTPEEYARLTSAGADGSNMELFNSILSLIFGARR